MTVTREDLKAIEQYVRALAGQRVRGGIFAADDTLRIDFSPAPKSHEGDIAERWLWRLWVLDAMWRLQTVTDALVGSGDPRSKREEVLQLLNGCVVRAVEVLPPGFESIFMFECGLFLHLFPVHTRNYRHWALLTPDGYALEIGPGTTWTYRILSGRATSVRQQVNGTDHPC